MSRDIIFTTETDGLVKHEIVSDKYIHLFPNMLEIVVKIPGASTHLALLLNHGVTIPEHITKINGIDNDLIEKYGIVPAGAANLLSTMLMDGDCLVSHNVEFHLKVLKAFYFRFGKEFPDVSTKCLQKDLIDVCKVPFDADNLDKGFKKPSLDHIKQHFNIPKDSSKIDSLHIAYENTKGLLNEQRAIKPASF